MGKYEVVAGCYVPVGSGLKYKKPGQVVTLDDDDAAELSAYLKPVRESQKAIVNRLTKGVAKRNTPKVKADLLTESEREADYQAALSRGEVTSDAGEPTPAVQRVGVETLE